MSEVIAELESRVSTADGRDYVVNVAADSLADGRWEAWLEFLPLDDSEPLMSAVETRQSTRADLEHWVTTLTDTYLEGAFARAVPVGSGSGGALATARIDTTALDRPPLLDPFALMTEGKAYLREQLTPLSRGELLAVIAGHHLNPAGLSLAWLTRGQLVTFIVTATEAQLRMR